MHKLTVKNNAHSEYDLYNDLQNIKAALKEASKDVRGKANELLSESYDELEETSAALKDNAQDYISKKPFKSIGVAAIAGFILGYFTHK